MEFSSGSSLRPRSIGVPDGDACREGPQRREATRRIGLTNWLFDVRPLQRQLLAHPELWNEIKLRTAPDTSPHREVDDIWLRYNPLYNFSEQSPPSFNGEHESDWYPCIEHLQEAVELIEDLRQCVGAHKLGGVLITRVLPGKKVYPHQDHSWHAYHYDKYAIQICGNQAQGFCFEGEEVKANDGECYWFNNAYTHWVYNESQEARITLIVCLRKPECLSQ